MTGMERRSAWSRFARAREGVTAIEFALISIPFLLLIFAIIETGIAFGAQQLLTMAATEVAREIRTGILRADNIDDDSLRERICTEIRILMPEDCPELVVDLRHFDSFADAARIRIEFTGSGASRDLDTSQFRVDPGGSGTRNMMRLFYRWPVHMDLLRKLTANVQGDRTLLFAGVVWQNEPFRE